MSGKVKFLRKSAYNCRFFAAIIKSLFLDTTTVTSKIIIHGTMIYIVFASSLFKTKSCLSHTIPQQDIQIKSVRNYNQSAEAKL